MSLWIVLVIIGQFLNAIVSLIDKYIITSSTVVLRPLSYAFWVSILSSGSIIIFCFSWVRIPVDGIDIPSFAHIHAPSLLVAALSITAGYAFFTALVSYFTALKSADASDTVPVVGGLTACFTLLLAYSFLNVSLSRNFLFGFALLVVGTILVSRFRFTWRTMLSVTHAGLMFGIHYVAIKALFNATNFDTAFFWSRLAIVMVALSMLLIPEYYENIIGRTRRAKTRDGAIVLGNKVLAGVVSIVILKAIEHGSVSLVEALGGLQYLFLLVISVVVGPFFARDFGESVTTRDVISKLISIPLIALGFFLLFV
jgi:uncharacterized membrane protein